MQHVLVAYSSLSGNTEAAANRISKRIPQGFHVEMVDINRTHPERLFYDFILIGTYSINDCPAEVAQFVDEMKGRGPVAVFGTGDTQWGEDYCIGALKAAVLADSEQPVLMLEQNPSSSKADLAIERWVNRIFGV